MIITQDLLESVRTNFRAIFKGELDRTTAIQGWQNLVSEVPSDAEQNTYDWFGAVPKMENVTHRQASRRGLNRYSFTLVNEEWQSVIEVQRAALERDRLGQIVPRIRSMASEAARHPGELIMNLFETPGNAFDGAAFFGNTRVIGDSANIDNIVTGTGTTVAQFQADLASARGAMRSYQDDQGVPMGLIGNAIVVPGALEGVAYQALSTAQAGDGINQKTLPADFGNGGVFAGYRLWVNPYLSSVNDWYLLHLGAGEAEKPFVLQMEKRPELTGETDPNSAHVIDRRTFLYSAYGRYNAGVTDPRFAVKVDNT